MKLHGAKIVPLVLPYVDTTAMNLHLAEISTRIRRMMGQFDVVLQTNQV